MEINICKIEKMLKKYNQDHLLKFYNDLNKQEKQQLINQIQSINFEQINLMYENSKKDENLDNRFSPIDYIDKTEIAEEEKKLYYKIGEECVKKGEIAILTMAGGQGSRLGINGPKGAYELNIEGNLKSLFEIVFENIKNVKEKYGIELVWLIMTSEENDIQTKEYFKQKNYFNYNKDKIIFFKQSTGPILDLNGKLVLESKYKIKYASNGNGDVFNSIYKNNLLQKLKDNNVKYISFGGIDNILANPTDCIFLGIMIDKNYKIASKSIFKEDINKKSAVFCNIDGRPSILEYTYITDELLQLKNEKGKFLYRDENILAHIMTIDAVEEILKKELKYHRVFRRSTYFDIEKQVNVTKDSFKFEKFIFDAFNFFDNMLLLRVEAKKEFAPIKKEEDIKEAINLYLKK